MADTLAEGFARDWWVFALQGLAAVLFGVLALLLPGITLLVLVLLFGVFAIVDGLLALWYGVRSHSWSVILLSVLAVAVGVFAIIWPGLTAFALLLLIAAWLVLRGIYEIIASIQLRHAIEREWLLATAGILAVLVGLLLFAFPGPGILAILWLIGLFALLSGIMLLAFAYRLRRVVQQQEVHAH